MLKDCLEVFKERLRQTDGKLVLDTHIPADGTYLIVDREGNIKVCIDIVKDKKTKQIDRSHPEFNRIRFYDYESRLISMNKPMDPKKVIHSNSYLSFFVKKDSLNTGKLTEDIINGYYEVLKDPLGKKYKKSKEATRIYQLFEEQEGEVNQEEAERACQWIKDHIFGLEGIDLGRKDYLKIFFEADKEEYQREGRRYSLPNIYNNNDYNIEIHGEVLGIPDNNLGMNAKKPFLSIKSRKNPAPYLLNNEDVMLQKQFFDYLMNLVSEGKYQVYVDIQRKTIEGYRNDDAPEWLESGYYFRLRKGKTEAEISDQDNVTDYRRKLDPPFVFENVLDCEFKKHPEYEKHGTYRDRLKTGYLFDEVFFMNFLKNSFALESGEINIKDNTLKKMVLLSKNPIAQWMFIGRSCYLDKILYRALLEIMKECAEKNYIERVWWQFNLLYSMQTYFSKEKGENMGEIISNMKNQVKEKVFSNGVIPIQNDDEYYYCVGQLTRYLLSLSKAKDRSQSLLNPILNAKNDEMIKTRLMQLYKKYNYRISDGQRRVNNLLSMVEGYVPDSKKKADQEKILLGYVSDNVIYTAKEEK